MKFPFAASTVGVLLALAACASNVPPPQPPAQQAQEPERPKEIKVGLLLPLSGPASALGQDMLQAAQMALFDVGPNDVVLLPRDTGGTPQGARQAANGLIAEQVEVIIGPLFSQAVLATSPIAQAAGVPVVAFSNVASVAAPDTYLLGFRPEEQVARVVQFALQNVERRPDESRRFDPNAAPPPSQSQGFGMLERGPVRIAGLAPDDPYGATALQALRRAVIAGGGDLAMTAFYPPDLADPSAVVRQVADFDRRQAALEAERRRLEGFEGEAAERELQRLETLDTLGGPPFDAILIADGGDRLRSVASLLTFYDVDPQEVRFLGTMRWQDDPRVLEEPALRGGWFAAPPPETMAAFRTRFQNAFGTQPQQLAGLAYDATALVVIVARDLNDRDFDSLTLTNPEGFAGATGLFRLRRDGLADHGLAILEVDGANTRTIDPAPTSLVDQLAARQEPARLPGPAPAIQPAPPSVPAPTGSSQ